MNRHRLSCLLLGLLIMASGQAVEIDPPEVPNPYNVSERRALVDVLDETYHIKMPVTTSVDRLKSLYRKAWNDEQANLVRQGKTPDPRYAAASDAEDADQRKNKVIKEILELGGQATNDESEEALKAKFQRLRDDTEQRNKEARQRELAKEREQISAAVANDVEKRNVDKKDKQFGLGWFKEGLLKDYTKLDCTICKDASSLPSESYIEKAIRDAYTSDRITEAEKLGLDRFIVGYLKNRKSLSAPQSGYVPLCYSPVGFEAWIKFEPSGGDRERFQIDVFFLNYSPSNVYVGHGECAFLSSKRNPSLCDCSVDWILRPFSCGHSSAYPVKCPDVDRGFYSDDGQSIIFNLVDVRVGKAVEREVFERSVPVSFILDKTEKHKK